MFHKTYLVLVLFLFSGLGDAAAGDLSPALSQQLQDNPDSQSLTVLVFLHNSLDLKALDLNLHQQKAPLAFRHRTVVESLQDFASRAQAGLIQELESQKSQGADLEFKPYWIVNAIRLKASESTIREIAARPDVDVVEVNFRPVLIEPTARYKPQQLDPGSRGIGITPGLVNIGARRVWEELGIRGEGTLIASLDTGVDGNHPALASRWRGNHAPWQECWLDQVYDTYEFPTDLNGHGTHCTGTMIGLALDDTIGVAPAAEWIAANPIDHSTSTPDFDPDIIACFEWFADPDGNPETLDDVPDVIQNSWGVNEGFGYPNCDSRWWEAIDACEAAGPVVVFAAGNEGPTPSGLRSPSDRATSLTSVFSVGATLHSPPFTIADFSSRGPAGLDCGPAENLIKPEVSGPGVEIYSAEASGGYINLSGTSMATPHVCGVVALMRSANPDLDVISIKEILMGTSHDLGPAGEDNDYGHGFIDAYAAVSQAMSGFGWIEGVVTDAGTGEAMSHAQVQLVGSYWTTTTDSEGYFHLRAPSGPQVIQVGAYSYEDLDQPVLIPAGDTLIQNLIMTRLPRITLSGTVYLPGGNPVDGGTPASDATISINHVPEPSTVADGSGQFSLDLPFGFDYSLSVTSGIDGYLNQTIPFDQDLNLDLFLNQGNAEGFESGDFLHFNWIQAGASDWYVQGDEVHSGDFAARSGAIGDGQYSQIYSYVNCGDGGDMTFSFKLSSQADDDFLRVQIDNEVVGLWSGEMDWTQVSFPIGSGTHVVRIRYYKGSSGASGSDAAWIDDLIFPGGSNHAPKVVPWPPEIAVAMQPETQAADVGYIFNMGLLDLDWNLSESADWLDISPTSGTLLPGTFQEITAAFSAVGLLEGVYTANINLESNDPANPNFLLLARMEVWENIVAAPDSPPAGFAILGAVPNPFNPATMVRFHLPTSQKAQLNIYDVRGHLVTTLIDEPRPAGLNEVAWNGTDRKGRAVSSGTYFARLVGKSQIRVMALTLIR